MTNKEKILDYLEHVASNPLLPEELCASLAVPEEKRGKVYAALSELEQEFRVVRTKKGRYGAASRMGMLIGRFVGNERGFGFVEQEDKAPEDTDLFIPAEHVGSALNGDTVLAKYTIPATKNRRAEGEIVRVLEHANGYIVGTYEESDEFGFVTPDERRIGTDVFIRQRDRHGAKQDDKVVVEVTRWRERGHSPEGKVVEILGNKHEIGTDILSIIRRKGIRDTFPEHVMEEVAQVEQTVSPKDRKGRLDLRGLDIVTIDGADAKDLDDAISLELTGDGCYMLGVHIADVSHYVRFGTALDKEAFARGTSTYLVDRVIPMLPRELSNGICSLNPKMDRLTLTVFMKIDQTGKIVDHSIHKSVIKTNARMTYADVTAILVDRDPKLMKQYADLVPLFERMEIVSNLLRKRRAARGSIDFDFPEAKIVLDDAGKPIEIKKYEITISNRIIEDFMLACNETVAEHMKKAKIPFIYRVHEVPNADKMKSFVDFLGHFGYTLKHPDKPNPKEFQKLLHRIRGKKEERVISTVMLRSLMKARYDESNLGHFGLAAKYYCHFTSPIRRYPDLVIHGIIKDMLDNKPMKKAKLSAFVAKAAVQSSEREVAAVEAERETDDLKKAEYMADRIGEVYEGVISSVTSFGMFVELENTIEGLVRMVDLNDDYYLFDEKRQQLVGEHTKRTFRVGDTVEVVVAKADVANRQIDFVLSDGQERRADGERKGGRHTGKKQAKTQNQKKASQAAGKSKTGASQKGKKRGTQKQSAPQQETKMAKNGSENRKHRRRRTKKHAQ